MGKVVIGKINAPRNFEKKTINISSGETKFVHFDNLNEELKLTAEVEFFLSGEGITLDKTVTVGEAVGQSTGDWSGFISLDYSFTSGMFYFIVKSGDDPKNLTETARFGHGYDTDHGNVLDATLNAEFEIQEYTTDYVVAENRMTETGASFRLHGLYGVSGAFEITFADGTELCAYSFMVYVPKGWDGSRFLVHFPVAIPFDGGYNIADFVAVIENFTLMGFQMKEEDEYGNPTIKPRLDNVRCMRFYN